MPEGSCGRSASLAPSMGAPWMETACAAKGKEVDSVEAPANAPAPARKRRRDKKEVIPAPEVENANVKF
jgi:hypothetical protein